MPDLWQYKEQGAATSIAAVWAAMYRRYAARHPPTLTAHLNLNPPTHQGAWWQRIIHRVQRAQPQVVGLHQAGVASELSP